MAVPGGSEAMPDGEEVLRPWAEPEAGSQHHGQRQESTWMLLSTMDSIGGGVGLVGVGHGEQLSSDRGRGSQPALWKRSMIGLFYFLPLFPLCPPL